MGGHVIFTLDAQRFAVDAADVVEIVRVVAGARVPVPPPLVESVIDFHGRLVPVLDLRARFGLPAKDVARSDRLIVARAAGRVVALRVDAVTEVAALTVEAPRDVAAHLPHVVGLAKTADGIVVVQDLPAFLSAAEAAAVDQALVDAEASS